MLRLPQLNLRGVYDSTVEFLYSLSPVIVGGPDNPYLTPSDPGYREGHLQVPDSEQGYRSIRRASELEQVPEDNIDWRAELRSLQAKHSALETALRDTRRLLEQRDEQLDALREDNRRLEASYNDLRRFSEEQSAEVKSLEKFLNTTDKWPGAQVVQTVKDLNSEILQFSAAASEAFPLERDKGPSTPSQSTTQAVERIESRLGLLMSEYLTTKDHSQDPTILQFALQASISQCVQQALSYFCVGFPGKFDALLSKLHYHMHTREPQATSARWRALTHRHIRALTPEFETQAVNDVVESAIRETAYIFCASGYGSLEEQRDQIRKRFWMQLQRIGEATFKIALIVREGTMSTDFQLVYVEHSRDFRPDTMENAYEGYGPSLGVVLCTTDLGIRCYTQKERTAGEGSNQTTVERRIILKPKVVLESVIDALDLE